jgi:hypothetical protein
VLVFARNLDSASGVHFIFILSKGKGSMRFNTIQSTERAYTKSDVLDSQNKSKHCRQARHSKIRRDFHPAHANRRCYIPIAAYGCVWDPYGIPCAIPRSNEPLPSLPWMRADAGQRCCYVARTRGSTPRK